MVLSLHQSFITLLKVRHEDLEDTSQQTHCSYSRWVAQNLPKWFCHTHSTGHSVHSHYTWQFSYSHQLSTRYMEKTFNIVFMGHRWVIYAHVHFCRKVSQRSCSNVNMGFFADFLASMWCFFIKFSFFFLTLIAQLLSHELMHGNF